MAYRLPLKLRRLPPFLCAPDNMPGPRTITQCRYHRHLRGILRANHRAKKQTRFRKIKVKRRDWKVIKWRKFHTLFNRILF